MKKNTHVIYTRWNDEKWLIITSRVVYIKEQQCSVRVRIRIRT